MNFAEYILLQYVLIKNFICSEIESNPFYNNYSPTDFTFTLVCTEDLIARELLKDIRVPINDPTNPFEAYYLFGIYNRYENKVSSHAITSSDILNIGDFFSFFRIVGPALATLEINRRSLR